MTIDIGRVGIWTSALDAHPAAQAKDAARQLEAMGFPVLWIGETTGRDPFVLSTLLLSATSQITVATGIANVYARDAVTMATCQKSLSEAYPGRFLLGLGVSSPVLVERVRRHSYDKPLTYLRSYLDAMDAAPYTAVPPAEDAGRVLAALGPRMLELAASRANGAHPYLTTPEHTKRAREIVGPDALLAPEQMVAFETDPETARAIGRSALSFYLRAPATWPTCAGSASRRRTGQTTRPPRTGSSIRSWRGATSRPSPAGSANTTTRVPTTCACRSSRRRESSRWPGGASSPTPSCDLRPLRLGPRPGQGGGRGRGEVRGRGPQGGDQGWRRAGHRDVSRHHRVRFSQKGLSSADVT